MAIIAVLIVLIIAIGSDLNKRVDKIQELKQTLVAKNQASGSLVELRSQAEEANHFFSILNDRLPARDALIKFQKEILDLATKDTVELGLTIGNESPGSESEPGSLSFSMSTVSGYQDFVRFIKAVEKYMYFIQFNSFNLVRDGESDRFNGNLSGRVFAQPFSKPQG